MGQDYFRPENAWKSLIIDGRQAWRAVVKGHELFAQARSRSKNYFNWWITSDKDGNVVTARGAAESLAQAQQEAIAEARKLAPGQLSTVAFLPSEIAAIKDGTIKKLDRGLSNGTKVVRLVSKGAKKSARRTKPS